jgi:protein SDA1
MGPISPAKGPAPITLPMLQNLMKRDPLGYTDEFRRRYRHFQSVLALHREQPSADSKDMVASVSFISHVSPCYPEVARELPAQLASLLEEQHDTLDSNLRAALFQALVLLRNRGMLKALDLLQLCFRLFRCRSKVLRAKVIAHVLADLKLVNLKHKDVTLNRALQNYVITMLTDVSSSAAKYSLNVMIQMYRRGIWRDAKTVNVVAGALFCPHPKLRVAAIHFLLGAHDLAAGAADSDDEEAEQNKKARVDDLRGSLGRNGALVKTAVKKRKRALKRATRSAKSLEKDKEGDSGGNGNFAAIHLLHDPHTLAERLLSDVRKSNERFEVRLLTLNLISRLIGTHRLMLPPFYPFLLRYMQPHQREVTGIPDCVPDCVPDCMPVLTTSPHPTLSPQVTGILAACVQASHELVPPDMLEPVVKTLVNHFVSDKSRPEVITLGLNTVRELCVRVPLCMDAALLADLIEYRKEKDRGVVSAARGLLQHYRDVMPELLPKKLRGRGTDVTMRPAAFGALAVAEGVDGAELLAAREARLAAKGVDVDHEAEQEWQVGGSEEEEEDDDEDGDVDDEEGEEDEDEDEDEEEDEGPKAKRRKVRDATAPEEEGEEEDEADDKDEEEAEGEEVSDEEDEEEGEEDEEEGEEEEGEEEDESEDEEDEDEDEEDEEDRSSGPVRSRPASAASGAAQSLASSASARPDISRLLTPKDFDRIRRLKHRQKEIASLRGAKRKRAESEMLDSDEEEEAEARRRGGAGIEGEAVDEKDIIGYQAKRAATREEKIANTLAGREGRAQFGRRQKKKTGGKSNEEKKKSKPFMMARNASKLKGKAMNKEANRIKAARRAKKMFRGALRKGDNRR